MKAARQAARHIGQAFQLMLVAGVLLVLLLATISGLLTFESLALWIRVWLLTAVFMLLALLALLMGLKSMLKSRTARK